MDDGTHRVKTGGATFFYTPKQWEFPDAPS